MVERARALLGVAPGASEKELRRAYKARSLVCHPDKRPAEEQEQATREFAVLSEAFALLCAHKEPEPPPVRVPEGMRAMGERRGGEGAAVVQWERVEGATAYRLEVRTAQGEWKECYCGARRKVAVEGLAGGLLYEFRATALRGPQASIPAFCSCWVPPDPHPPPPPPVVLPPELPQAAKQKKKKKKKKRGVRAQATVVENLLPRCSRCKQQVEEAAVEKHECDTAVVLMRILGWPESNVQKARDLLARAGGEINAAIDLLYSQA